MANLQEFSSSFSYTSPSCVSNGSRKTASQNLSCGSVGSGAADPAAGNVDVVSLRRLSGNLERLISADDALDCTDAEVLVEGTAVGVHRCILAVRSPFFYDLFARKGGPGGRAGGEKPRYVMSDLVPFGHVGLEAFKDLLWYIYTAKVKAPDPAVATCVDDDCVHDACRPAIASAVELMYASSIFQIPELVSLLQRRLVNFVEKAFVEDVIPILLVGFHSKQSQLIEHCVRRIAISDLDDMALQKELPHDLAEMVRSSRSGSLSLQPVSNIRADTSHEKGVKRIHRALDSDDVELVKMLLTESEITLDDAHALHYAASYCDSKVVAEVLELAEANVNLKNGRGYTPLHLAAMRRDPAVIIALLRKGAYVFAITEDGRNAVGICRRLTRMKDYTRRTEQGEESNRDRICIDILERETRRIPMSVEEIMVPPLSLEDLQLQLPYYETRVALASMFFPAEAKVALEIAENVSKYPPGGSKGSRGSLSFPKEVDFNENAAMKEKRLQSKMLMLKKTVQLGRRYFPNCSEVLDKIMDDDDISELNRPDQGNPDIIDRKRKRYHKIQKDVEEAFSKDKARNSSSGISSSSLSSPPCKRDRRLHKPSIK